MSYSLLIMENNENREGRPIITHALMRAARDIGHGGPTIEYRIDFDKGVYTITRFSSRLTPAPGERRFSSVSSTDELAKDDGEVREFLYALITKHRIYDLTDLSWTFPFLHPTFYTFQVEDSTGRAHRFEYRIECSNHLDSRHEKLVRAFEVFFDSGSAADRNRRK